MAAVWSTASTNFPSSLPAPARWITEGFTGALVDFADLAAADNPEELVGKLLKDIHALIVPRMAADAK